jgi:hypothetical protein
MFFVTNCCKSGLLEEKENQDLQQRHIYYLEDRENENIKNKKKYSVLLMYDKNHGASLSNG